MHIDIKEGWTGEHLSVLVDGREVFAGAVSTRLQIGLADQVETTVAPGPVTVEAVVAATNLRAALEVHVTGEYWVGISLGADRIVMVGQSRLFGYL